jgi:hypothetical protein
MPTKIWCRDQASDIVRKGELAYKCYRAPAHAVWLPADIAPDAPFLTDSIIADLKAIAAERVGP